MPDYAQTCYYAERIVGLKRLPQVTTNIVVANIAVTTNIVVTNIVVTKFANICTHSAVATNMANIQHIRLMCKRIAHCPTAAMLGGEFVVCKTNKL